MFAYWRPAPAGVKLFVGPARLVETGATTLTGRVRGGMRSVLRDVGVAVATRSGISCPLLPSSREPAAATGEEQEHFGDLQDETPLPYRGLRERGLGRRDPHTMNTPTPVAVQQEVTRNE